MKVSVIMSAYNSEKTIKKAIESVLDQTYKDFELIIVNDCSTDATSKIIESFDDSRIRVINHIENKGAGWARNTGVKNVSGDYITFLDSDDYYDSDYIETLLNAAIKYDADIVSSGIRHIDNNKVTEEAPEFGVYEGEDKWCCKHKIKKESPLYRFLNVTLSRKSLWDKVEYSTERYIEDSPTLYKLLYFCRVRVCIPQIKYNYIAVSTSLTHTADLAHKVIYRSIATIDIMNFNKRNNIKSPNLLVRIIKELKNNLGEEDYKKYPEELSRIFYTIINNIEIQ